MLPRFSRKIDQFPQGNQEHVYYGEKNVLQEHCVDAQVCPDLVLAFIAAAGAFALLGMYTAATQNTNGRRKKRRRSLDGYATPEILDVPLMILIGNDDKIMSSQLCACVLFTNACFLWAGIMKFFAYNVCFGRRCMDASDRFPIHRSHVLFYPNVGMCIKPKIDLLCYPFTPITSHIARLR